MFIFVLLMPVFLQVHKLGVSHPNCFVCFYTILSMPYNLDTLKIKVDMSLFYFPNITKNKKLLTHEQICLNK